NRQRNHAIRDQALEVAATLNTVGIRPVLLKGSLGLFEDGVDDGVSMMTDIDVLLQESELATGAAALRSLGYFVLGDPPRHAHAWTFHRPMSLVTIDLHRHLGPQREVLTPMAARDAAVPVVSSGVMLAGLCPTDRALLLIMTFGIFERDYRNAV